MLETFKNGKIPLVVILDNVRSMHNVGAAFRTADAFWWRKDYSLWHYSKPPHREIHKSSIRRN